MASRLFSLMEVRHKSCPQASHSYVLNRVFDSFLVLALDTVVMVGVCRDSLTICSPSYVSYDVFAFSVLGHATL